MVNLNRDETVLLPQEKAAYNMVVQQIKGVEILKQLKENQKDKTSQKWKIL